MLVSNETFNLFLRAAEDYTISLEAFGSLVTQLANIASTVDAEPAVDDFKPASMRKLKGLYE
jgi:hypothetical protein